MLRWETHIEIQIRYGRLFRYDIHTFRSAPFDHFQIPIISHMMILVMVTGLEGVSLGEW